MYEAVLSMFDDNNEAKAPKVSVIVPVYNVERFLAECLDSLINQSLEDIEIICVNDGSTDSSLEILRRYEKRDSRVKVVDKPNAGYGHTMNMGISKARGEYIGITESDDIASKNMYKKLYTFAKKNDCDLVKSNYFEHSKQGDKKIKVFKGLPYRKVFDPRVDQRALVELPIIWSGLYRRQLLIDNGIRFNESPGASYQDTSFVLQVWASARRAALLPDAFLRYRVDNEGSSVLSNMKVYEVCEEYALSMSFLKADPERYEAFSSIINLLKLGTYRWNFNRIIHEERRGFAKRMSLEFKEALEEGTLDKSHFAPWDWDMLQLLISDVDAFMQEFGEGM